MRSRSVRLLAALVAAFSLLFAQLAVAAYACPVQAPAKMSAHGGAHPCPGGHCQDMAKQQPTLCQAHCHPADSSPDRSAWPPVAQFTALAAFVIMPAPRVHDVAQTDVFTHPILARATEPPSAIRHCCFRI